MQGLRRKLKMSQLVFLLGLGSQHDAIIAALKSGQPDTAAKMMRAHMEASLEHRLKVLQLDG